MTDLSKYDIINGVAFPRKKEKKEKVEKPKVKTKVIGKEEIKGGAE